MRELEPGQVNTRRGERGFTLVELLIVVTILGILAGIVVVAVSNLSDDAAAQACNADAKSAETAAEAFKAKTGQYPTYAELQADTTVGTVTVDALLKSASSYEGAASGPAFTYAVAGTPPDTLTITNNC